MLELDIVEVTLGEELDAELVIAEFEEDTDCEVDTIVEEVKDMTIELVVVVVLACS